MSRTQIRTLRSVNELNPIRNDWNSLAEGNPFRSWEWQVSWAEQFVPDGDLFVIQVVQDGITTGIAPWWRRRTLQSGRTLEFLGAGRVASDHLSILCGPQDRQEVCDGVACHLTHELDAQWDSIDLVGADESDACVGQLFENLSSHRISTQVIAAVPCWVLELPDNWENYLSKLSKAQRKHVRRTQRAHLDTGNAQIVRPHDRDSLNAMLRQLVRLHQKRWGDEGCFVDDRFESFLFKASERLWASGQLQLTMIEHGSLPLAVEYSLLGGQTAYSYQSGIDVDRLRLDPGRILNIATIQHSLSEGHRFVDFLRGNEPYKATWRAKPYPTQRHIAVAPRVMPRIRNQVRVIAGQVKSWLGGNESLLSPGSTVSG